MISRLTASATCFAVLSAATITFAANTTTQRDATVQAASASVAVVQLPRVEVIGHRAGAARR